MNKQIKAYRQRVAPADRDLIRSMIEEAAATQGMRPRKFLRKYRKEQRRNKPGPATHALNAVGRMRDIDPDRLREILQIILDFLLMLLKIFAVI